MLKKKQKLTAIAAFTTACSQACASGDGECVAMCKDSWRLKCVTKMNSKTSPAQSSGSSAKASQVLALWAMAALRTQAKTAAQAARGAQRKDGSSW